MPWDGNGTFTRTNGTNTGSALWAADDTDGVKVRPDRHDIHDQDLADAIELLIRKDGDNPITANQPMGGNVHTDPDQTIIQTTGLVEIGTDQDGGIIYCGDSTGSANTYTIDLGSTNNLQPLSLLPGTFLSFKAHQDSTSTQPTIEVTGAGTTTPSASLYKMSGAVGANDIKDGKICVLGYSNTGGGRFYLLNPTD